MTRCQEIRVSIYVAFGSWRCNCTMLAATLELVPDVCPVHAAGLLGPASWEVNLHRVPMGYSPDHRGTA